MRMTPLFSDRFWTLKVLAALGLIAWLCTIAAREVGKIHPQFERAAVWFEVLQGKEITAWGHRVVGRAPDGFDMDTRVGPFRVLSPLRPEPGNYVSVRARIVGPRTLQALSIELNDGFLWKRALNYIVSVAVLLGFAWRVRKRFAWNLRDGLFRSRY